jgi:hypothetical protein
VKLPLRLAVLLLGATVARSQRAADHAPPVIFSSGPDWPAIAFTPARIAPGSALDFSGFLRAPAGRDGEIVNRAGQFVAAKAPDRPLRFYGAVMSHGMPFLDRAESDRLVDYLAACGYNLIRFHLYTAGTPSVMASSASPDFNPQARDRLDYFLAGLRRKGIYFMFPLNNWGFFDGSVIHDVPEFKSRMLRSELNPYLPISRDASNWLKQFARGLLVHRNPYTGVDLKDDPALVGIELSNEDSLFWELHRNPSLIPLYQRVERERLHSQLGRAPTAAEAEAAFPRFILNLQDEFYQDLKAALRAAGVNKPLTDATDHDPIGHVLNRTKFDYVDLHGYWALYHALPASTGNEPSYSVTLANPNATRWSTVLSATAPGRIFGLPFASCEYNSSYPTPYWTFSGPFEGAIAAVQGWSALARSGLWPYAKTAFNPSPSVRIESGHHPVLMLSERIGALLFSAGDLPPLPAKAPMVLTPEYIRSKLNLRGGPNFPLEYSLAAYRCQIGTVLWTGKENLSSYPVVVMPPDQELPAQWPGKTVVRTGEPGFAARLDKALTAAGFPARTDGFTIDAERGSAQIITPRSEAFMLPATVASAHGASVGVQGNSSVAVVFAGALDRRPLPESNRILALYLTEGRNTGTEIEYAPKELGLVRHNGTLPLLLRQGRVQMTFHTGDRPLPEVWALRYDGTRASELKPWRVPGGFACAMPAVSAPDVFSAYELLWNQPTSHLP